METIRKVKLYSLLFLLLVAGIIVFWFYLMHMEMNRIHVEEPIIASTGGDHSDEVEHVKEIAFREIDLSVPFGDGEFWEDMGVDARGDVDLSQFVGQAIESIEMATSIANVILEQQQESGFLAGFVLVSIGHDLAQNIWIFSYGEYPSIPGMPFYAAVDGHTSQLLRTWVY